MVGRVRTHDYPVPDCSAGAQGYQSFTQAAGLLGLVEARDAFLSSLCAFTLGSGAADDPTSPGGNRGDPSSPTSAGMSPGLHASCAWRAGRVLHLQGVLCRQGPCRTAATRSLRKMQA